MFGYGYYTLSIDVKDADQDGEAAQTNFIHGIIEETGTFDPKKREQGSYNSCVQPFEGLFLGRRVRRGQK